MSLIRYYYSEMNHIQRAGGAFYKPLFFDFPNDGPEVYSHQYRNIMLGNHIKLGQMSDFGKGTTNYNIYFPKGVWCEIFKKHRTSNCITQETAGSRIDTQYPWDYYVSLREGSIIPIQNNDWRNPRFPAKSTRELQNGPIEIHILPNCTHSLGLCHA